MLRFPGNDAGSRLSREARVLVFHRRARDFVRSSSSDVEALRAARLPKYIVIVANDAYLPGRVNFSARSATGVNVLEFLRSKDVDARGHDQATGASLSVEQWNEFLAKLSFS